jgi:heme/copper-type cytochrome/quinol oxidase subunit 3
MSAAPTTAASAATRPQALAREVPAGRRPGWWGMVLTLATDVAAFAALLAAYFYVRFVTAGNVWPPDGITEPKLLKPVIMTVLLIGSSAPLVIADLGIKRGARGRLLVGVPLAALMGAAFLFLQYQEYGEKLREFTPQTNAYGSLFFVITGFHGLHVAVGVIALALILVAALSGRITRKHHAIVRITGLYWHTVGGVWILIFASLYLAARL